MKETLGLNCCVKQTLGSTWSADIDRLVLVALVTIFTIVALGCVAAAVGRKLSKTDAEPDERRRKPWKRAVKIVLNRRNALAGVINPEGIPPSYKPEAELAAIDLFVEKAQLMLTRRGDRHRWLGQLTSVLVFEILLLAVIALLWLVQHASSTPTWQEVVLRVASAASIAGVLLGAAFFMGSLSRAHLHEATTLYNRRHMLRSGRLFLYLKFSGAEGQSLERVRRSLKVEDLERAFGGIHETSTAFKDIKTEVLTSTWLGQLIQAVARRDRQMMG